MKTDKPNVLFLTCDDLRPALACFGDVIAKTPNLDRLAASGMKFERNYCQVPICNPSRSSFLTGRRPDTTRVWANTPNIFREAIPDVVTLPQYFMDNGYHTESIGKVFCNFCPDERSWSVPEFDQNHSWFHKYAIEKPQTDKKGIAAENADAGDDAFPDGKVANAAVQAIERLKDEAFFLGVGFWKPHVPYNSPKKYWDLYERKNLKTPLPDRLPIGVPLKTLHNFLELRGYQDVPDQGPLSPELIGRLRHGFYAAISHLDAMVGRVLDALDSFDLTDKTIVAFMPDHGIHLGEQGLWSKGTLFELDTHVPLIVRYPGQIQPGISTKAITESIDIYPSLIDLAGLTPPEDTEGTSFRPLTETPNRPWKQAAFSQRAHFKDTDFGRLPNDPTPDSMQISVRTDRWRFNEWVDWQTTASSDIELYDYSQDPVEITNVAAEPGNKAIIENLRQIRQKGWKSAAPNTP